MNSVLCKLRRNLLAIALAATPVLALATEPAPSAQDVLAAHIDHTVDPGVDFFSYANGAWLKSHPIPASESQWGIGQEVQNQLFVDLRKISETAAKAQAPAGSDQQKIGDFWSTAMNRGLADKLGLSPLRVELARIDAANDLNSLLDVAFGLQPLGVDVLFDVGVYQDEKASDQMAVHLGQGGLGLPDRSYYFNQEAGVAEVRRAYLQHLQKLLQLQGIGASDASGRAAKVMVFETALAGASRPLEALRDPQANYHLLTSADLSRQYTPAIDWTARLAQWQVAPGQLIVGQPEFFRALQQLLASTPVPVLQDYLRLHLLDDYSSFLGQPFEDEYFDFHGRVLTGQQQQRPRWKRVLQAENRTLGMILGRIYVKDYFPAASKARYNAMVEAIRTAYAARIQRLDWMSPPTKAKAEAKLAAITKKVGYPDHWKDYASLKIGRESYAQNVMAGRRWEFADMMSKFGKPVDRSEWDMTPQTYNAYYNPSNNEIVLPAAQFMIPGVRDEQLDDAVVYGYAAASTIGHEMTHGFDDEGRQFDAQGNLKDWWTAQDASRFQARARVMVQQFNAYQPLPGLHINGQASLGENIADFGGILLGLDAFKRTAEYAANKPVAGLTPLQRFFLGYALGWLSQEREGSLRQGLLSDVHAPAKWRVNGPMSNIPEFYQAFGVKPGQPMWRPADQRVDIW